MSFLVQTSLDLILKILYNIDNYIIALFDHFWARSGQIVAIISDLDDSGIIIMIIYILYKHNNNKKKMF